MTQEEQYLDVLSIFHYVLGGLIALFSSIFLLHVAMGIAMLMGDFNGEQGPPQVFGLIFTIFPALFVLGGWTLGGFVVAAGRKLKRRRSHTFCFVVAAVECMLMPLGTILGVFTIITLMKEPVKDLFAAAPPSV